MQLDANDKIYNQALIDLEDKVLFIGGKPLDAFGLPPANADILDQPLEILTERHQNHHYLQDFVAENITKLTRDQKFANETIAKDVAWQREELFFLNPCGGTGKTFPINLLLATF